VVLDRLLCWENKKMLSFRLGKLIFVVSICMMFITIYQHNLIIGLSYERQRLELKKNQLKKQESDLRRQLCFLRDADKVDGFARNKFGMDKINFSQVISFTGL
jgi:hypothetical protein